MKNGFCLFLFLCTAFCFAEIPQSIMMESGNIRVRLDAKKRWNINRIEYCNELLGKDSPGAHYGMTCRPRHLKYAVGSGHEETGFGEKVNSFISAPVRYFRRSIQNIGGTGGLSML